MMKSFNVKHTHTIELNLEKGGNESVTSEYTTFAHFYERKDGNKEERIIDKYLKPIVDIASHRWYYDKCIKLTTDGNVVKSIKEVGNKVISINDDLGGKAPSLEQLLEANNGIAYFQALYDEKKVSPFKRFCYSPLSFHDDVINDLISIVSFMKIPKDKNIVKEIASTEKVKVQKRSYNGAVEVSSYETLNPEKWLDDVIINTWLNW